MLNNQVNFQLGLHRFTTRQVKISHHVTWWGDYFFTHTVGFVGFMLVMVKAILYERTVAVCASMDFGKGLGRSSP